ncbi:MAG TPA: M50 family metallopeptidase [Dehalococcoidia bacterium]|nr:M50 family metallopeptidase [Dehalococcoidia bacterium]
MSSARRYGNTMTAVSVVIAIAVAYVLATDAVTAGLIFAFMLVGLVVAHEFAHFVTAKMFGVYVHEFGIGFPPRVWGKRFGETEYTLNWLPLGGFVRLMGEEDPSDPRSLAAKPRWQRLIILASGGVANLILPTFLFAIAFTIPHEEGVGRAVVTSVIVGAPADEAGMRPGDVIYEIAGRDSRNLNEAGRLVRLNVGKEFDIVVKRGEDFLALPVYARWTPPAGQGPTGITIGSQYDFTETVSLPPWESIPMGFRQTFDTIILARNELIIRVKGGGDSGPAVRGPVGLAQATGEIARAGGAPPLFELAALLSINLGVLNLLPLPMLDGGRIAFLLLEVVRRGKRVAPEREALVHLVGLVLFVLLFVAVTFADISRIASGESAFR